MDYLNLPFQFIVLDVHCFLLLLCTLYFGQIRCSLYLSMWSQDQRSGRRLFVSLETRYIAVCLIRCFVGDQL